MRIFKKGDIIIRTKNPTDKMSVGTICKVKSNTFFVLRLEDHEDTTFSPLYFELLSETNWCIKGSPELRDWEVYDMENSCNLNLYLLNFDRFYYPQDKTLLRWMSYDELMDNSIELTFEQFRKYIIKKSSRKPFKLNR